MKDRWMQQIAGAILIASLGVPMVHAESAGTKSDINASEARFRSVASHLDLGGDFYFYLNLEDLVELAVQRGQEFLEPFADEEMVGLITEKLAVADEILREAGLYNIASVGMSSKPVAGGLNRGKTFIGIDDFLEQGSLWKILGGPPTEMAVHTFVPENPSLVRSFNVDPSAGWAWVRSIVEKIGGEEVLSQLDAGLKQGQEVSGVHPEGVLDSLGTSFLVSAYLDPEQTLSIPLGPEPYTLPAPSVLIAIEVEDTNIRDLLQSQLAATGMLMSTQKIEEVDVLLMPVPLPAPIPLQPAMAQKDDVLLIASTPDLLRRALAARAGTGRFLDSDTFARAFAGLPRAVNGLAYVDASVSELIVDAQVAGMGQEFADQPEVLSALREWLKRFTEAEGAAVQVNLQDGILMEVLSNSSGREQIATLLTIVPTAVAAAILVPALTRVPRVQAGGAACTSNLHMIDAAKQMWALDANIGEGEMPAPEGLQPYFPNGLPVCPEGGAYTLGPVGTPPSCSMHGSVEPH